MSDHGHLPLRQIPRECRQPAQRNSIATLWPSTGGQGGGWRAGRPDILHGAIVWRRERNVAIVAERIRTISVTRLHPVIGAEIGGVNLCRPLDAETLRQIKDAWHEHTVLLFRGQSLSEDDQRRFASYFGPVATRVPPKPGATGVGDAPAWNDMMLVSDKLDATGKPLGALGHGEMWFHTDKCYHRRPHRVSFLYGIEIPSAGGHTKFSSMYAAYDKLPT